MFIRFMAEMKASGYTVSAPLLDAQWLGVPQGRRRLIFMGVRNDLGLHPVWPKPFPYRYTLRDALPWIKRAVHDTRGNRGAVDFTNRPCPTITVGVGSLNSVHYLVEPEADISRFAIGREWDRLAPGQVSEKYQNLVRPDPEKRSRAASSMGSLVSTPMKVLCAPNSRISGAIASPREQPRSTTAVCGWT